MEISQPIVEELLKLPDALTNLQGDGEVDVSLVETPSLTWSQTGVKQDEYGGQGDYIFSPETFRGRKQVSEVRVA